MPELSIAISYGGYWQGEAERRDVKIDVAHLELGLLSRVVIEALLSPIRWQAAAADWKPPMLMVRESHGVLPGV